MNLRTDLQLPENKTHLALMLELFHKQLHDMRLENEPNMCQTLELNECSRYEHNRVRLMA